MLIILYKQYYYGVQTVQNSALRVSLEMIGCCCFVQSEIVTVKIVTSLGKLFYNQSTGVQKTTWLSKYLRRIGTCRKIAFHITLHSKA